MNLFNNAAMDAYSKQQSIGVEVRVQVACLHCSYHNHSSYTNRMSGITMSRCADCELPVCSHCRAENDHCPIASIDELPNGPDKVFSCSEGQAKLNTL